MGPSDRRSTERHFADDPYAPPWADTGETVASGDEAAQPERFRTLDSGQERAIRCISWINFTLAVIWMPAAIGSVLMTGLMILRPGTEHPGAPPEMGRRRGIMGGDRLGNVPSLIGRTNMRRLLWIVPLAALAMMGGPSFPTRATAHDDEGWTPLFDGKTLDGWEPHGGTAKYRVEDGTIVGKTQEGSPNTFLCKGDFKNFILEAEVKCDPRLNSGIQVRSHVYGQDSPRAGVVYGPQCEIARQETGTAGRFYDEARRGQWICEINPEGKGAFKDDGWNHYRIVVQGNHYQSWVNGKPCADFTDDLDQHGLIGLQVHGISRDEGPYEVRWRNVRLKTLP
jgi:hypothetical protein